MRPDSRRAIGQKTRPTGPKDRAAWTAWSSTVRGRRGPRSLSFAPSAPTRPPLVAVSLE